MTKKFISLLLCSIFLLMLISCNSGSTTSATESSTNENGSQAADYTPITSLLYELARIKSEGGELPEATDPGDTAEGAIRNAIEICDPTLLGYATKDINNDGINELVIMSRGCNIYALFTIYEGKITLLCKSNGYAAIDKDGFVYYSDFKKDEYSKNFIQRLVNGSLEGLEYGSSFDGEGKFSYYKIENGVRSEITYQELLTYDNWGTSTISITKAASFRFIPIFEDETATAPKIDLESYDGILSVYRTVVEQMENYTYTKWVSGEYDTLYAFDDNESYAIFNSILRGCANGRPTTERYGSVYAEDGNRAYGYAKKDLDGDGAEELILMTDKYKIIEIFTQKDGKAVHIKDMAGCWIDGEGKIRKSVSTGGMVSRDGECYLYELKNGTLECIFGLGFKVNIYLQKTGWYKVENGEKISIPDSEGEELYSIFDNLPDMFVACEYTRCYASIDFIPLFERAEPTEKHLVKLEGGTWVGGSNILLTRLTENEADFELDLLIILDYSDKINPLTKNVLISGTATKEGSHYCFEENGFKGYIELAVNAVWVEITDSGDPTVDCRAYLFDYSEND